MNILVTIPLGYVRDTFIPPTVEEQINRLGTVTWNQTDTNFTSEELGRLLEDTDICITGWQTPPFSDEVLGSADRLKLIAHTAGSVANLVSDAVYDRQIHVVSGNRIFAESVAESVIAYALASFRKIPYYNGLMKQGGWRESEFCNQGLLGCEVGLIGFGEIARLLTGMLQPFHARVKAYDKYVSPEIMRSYGAVSASLEEIMETSRLISVHLSATPETYHLIGSDLIQKIPDNVLFINTSRGSVVDEEALVNELSAGRFQAVLDVFETEPLPSVHPLRTLNNVILMPHMGGPTTDRRRFASLAVIDDIRSFMEGKPLKHEISREYAGRMTRNLRKP